MKLFKFLTTTKDYEDEHRGKFIATEDRLVLLLNSLKEKIISLENEKIATIDQMRWITEELYKQSVVLVDHNRKLKEEIQILKDALND